MNPTKNLLHLLLLLGVAVISTTWVVNAEFLLTTSKGKRYLGIEFSKQDFTLCNREKILREPGDTVTTTSIPCPSPTNENERPNIRPTVALKDIFFDFDKDNIRPDAVPVLLENAEILKNNPDISVVIEGYTDIRGTPEYNLRLAQRRADATKGYLVKLGVDPSRIITASGGETTQFAAGTTEEAYQLNNRADFFVVNKPGN